TRLSFSVSCFFQAEDGIRDFHVTGVQTCALPILQDVVVQLFSYQDLAEPILVPAVVEPLLVLVLSGAATVEERALDGDWQATNEIGRASCRERVSSAWWCGRVTNDRVTTHDTWV